MTDAHGDGFAATRAAGVELLGPLKGSGYQLPPLLARRADGQTVQLTPLLYMVLEAMDGRRSWDGVARAVSSATGRQLTADDVRFLAREKLGPAGLLQRADGTDPVTTRWNPLLGLRGRLVVSRPALTRRLTTPFLWLFSWWVAGPVLLAFVAATTWTFAHGLTRPVSEALNEPTLLLGVVVATILSAAFHELGHAAACRYSGATPGSMGAALYLVWPVFYTDVTDSYRLDRRSRLRVDLGGLYFNAVFAVAAFALWLLIGADALLVILPIQLFQMLRQLIPLVRFDGYHILADLTGVPDLFAHIKPIILGMVGRADATPVALKRWVRIVVAGWVAIVVPALAGLVVLIIAALPTILGASVDSLGFHAEHLRRNLSTGDLERVALGSVAILTVALVPLGIGYLLARLAHRTGRGLWSATHGRPLVRGAAAVALVGVGLAAVPAGVPESGGIRAHAVAADLGDLSSRPEWVFEARALPLEVRLASLERPLERRAERILKPRPGLPAPLQVATAPASPLSSPGVYVLAPVDAWPFPFDPPAEARPGDNVVLAVATVDGATVVQVAAVLNVLADGAMADPYNVAYAAASCLDCHAVAVAFQVVVLVGQVDVAVPVNQAVAANYDCVGCTSEAVAVQLVVTLEEHPTVDILAQVDALLADLDALEPQLSSGMAAGIYGELLEIRDEIQGLLLGVEDFESPDEATHAPDEIESGTRPFQPADWQSLPAARPPTQEPVTGSPSASLEATPEAAPAVEPSTAAPVAASVQPATDVVVDGTVAEVSAAPADATWQPTPQPDAHLVKG